MMLLSLLDLRALFTTFQSDIESVSYSQHEVHTAVRRCLDCTWQRIAYSRGCTRGKQMLFQIYGISIES